MAYRSLNLEQEEIRLIVLQPGDGDDHVHVNIIYAFLADKPEYEALSYVWGDPTVTQTIKLVPAQEQRCHHSTTVDFQATTNLDVALRNLRYKDRSRTLWADAICINQIDELEKAHQIRLMGEIFRNASQVCLWVGDAAENSGAAMELATLCNKNREPEHFESLCMPEYVSSWRGVFHLALRPWFTRRWIVQEILLASESTVYCGQKSTTWIALGRAFWLLLNEIRQKSAGLLGKLPHFLDDWNISIGEDWAFDEGVHHFQVFCEAIVEMEQQGSLSFTRLLSLFYRKKVTDPLDTVYSVLALATGSQTERWSMDPYVSIEDIYLAAIEFSITVDQSLDIITLNLLRSSTILPSFVPDFHDDGDCPLWENHMTLIDQGMLRIPVEFQKPLYSASKFSTPTASILKHLYQLSVKGFIVDIIKMVAEPISEIYADLKQIPTSWRTSALSLRSMCLDGGDRRTGSFTTKESLHFDAFWRTLILDRDTTAFSSTRVRDQWSEVANEWARGDLMIDLPLTGLASRSVTALREFLGKVMNVVYRRAFVVTETSRLGLVSHSVQEGDLVCILFGCSVPVLLRPSKESGQEGAYIFVGDAYIHGIMDGDAMDRPEYDVRDFVLV